MRVQQILLIGAALTMSVCPANAADTVWRIADRIEVDRVPSWFPVGFALLTHGDRQYVAYYDAQHRMTVAARSLGERQWQRHPLDSRVGWDSHNYITMAVDSTGRLHLAGNMHCVPLIYFRTAEPGDITTFIPLPMTGRDEQRCTYPHFLNDAQGRLIFHYRDGGSGNGRRFYNVYEAASQTWSRLLDTPLFDGQGERNAYPLGPVLGPDGRFHVVWVWRDTPDCATNHNLSYVRSRDLVQWETAAGQPVELPIVFGTQGVIVDPVVSGGGLINGGEKLAFDSRKRPLIAYHRNDDDGLMQIYVARFEEGQWVRRVLTAWKEPVPFSGRGAMPFIGIRLSTPRKLDGEVWAVPYRHRDYGHGMVMFSEKTLQPVQAELAPPRPELPAELHAPEIDFEGIGVRHAADLGEADGRDIRYLMKWDVLPANHDRKRSGPLPPPATLRLYKLVRNQPE